MRYDANSQFNEHGHPDGEEILVLEGSWQGEFFLSGLLHFTGVDSTHVLSVDVDVDVDVGVYIFLLSSR